jgi:hypothetical protein
MPARNADHDAVRAALVADGWTITDDPLTLRVGDRILHIDLGAERSPIAAERAGELIAVEIQSFGSPSPVADLQQALGQFAMYRSILGRRQPDRTLFLAVPRVVYDGILSEPLGVEVLADAGMPLILYDPDKREGLRWIK